MLHIRRGLSRFGIRCSENTITGVVASLRDRRINRINPRSDQFPATTALSFFRGKNAAGERVPGLNRQSAELPLDERDDRRRPHFYTLFVYPASTRQKCRKYADANPMTLRDPPSKRGSRVVFEFLPRNQHRDGDPCLQLFHRSCMRSIYIYIYIYILYMLQCSLR